MDCRLNESKFALAERVLDVVKVEKIAVTDNFFYRRHPFFLIFFCEQVVATCFIARKNQFERIQNGGAVELLLDFVLDKNTN